LAQPDDLSPRDVGLLARVQLLAEQLPQAPLEQRRTLTRQLLALVEEAGMRTNEPGSDLRHRLVRGHLTEQVHTIVSALRSPPAALELALAEVQPQAAEDRTAWGRDSVGAPLSKATASFGIDVRAHRLPFPAPWGSDLRPEVLYALWKFGVNPDAAQDYYGKLRRTIRWLREAALPRWVGDAADLLHLPRPVRDGTIWCVPPALMFLPGWLVRLPAAPGGLLHAAAISGAARIHVGSATTPIGGTYVLAGLTNPVSSVTHGVTSAVRPYLRHEFGDNLPDTSGMVFDRFIAPGVQLPLGGGFSIGRGADGCTSRLQYQIQQVRTISRDDIRMIGWKVSGDGPRVVLLHCKGEERVTWKTAASMTSFLSFSESLRLYFNGVGTGIYGYPIRPDIGIGLEQLISTERWDALIRGDVSVVEEYASRLHDILGDVLSPHRDLTEEARRSHVRLNVTAYLEAAVGYSQTRHDLPLTHDSWQFNPEIALTLPRFDQSYALGDLPRGLPHRLRMLLPGSPSETASPVGATTPLRPEGQEESLTVDGEAVERLLIESGGSAASIHTSIESLSRDGDEGSSPGVSPGDDTGQDPPSGSRPSPSRPRSPGDAGGGAAAAKPRTSGQEDPGHPNFETMINPGNETTGSGTTPDVSAPSDPPAHAGKQAPTLTGPPQERPGSSDIRTGDRSIHDLLNRADDSGQNHEERP